MPTYEYACTSCAHEWEFEQSIKDAPLTECPACHAATARRQISRGTGFILKGSGWYADLYSSSSNKAPAKSEGASESKPAAAKSEGSSGGSKDGGTSSGTSGTPGGSGSPAPSGGTSGSSATSAAA